MVSAQEVVVGETGERLGLIAIRNESDGEGRVDIMSKVKPSVLCVLSLIAEKFKKINL